MSGRFGENAAFPKDATVKLEALRSVLKKTADEADFFDRQALAAGRFTSPAGAAEAAQTPKAPSPADSLAGLLAESSAEGSLPQPSPSGASDGGLSSPHASPASRSPASLARRPPAEASGPVRDRSRPSSIFDTVSHSPKASPRELAARSPSSAPRRAAKSLPKASPPSRRPQSGRQPPATRVTPKRSNVPARPRG